MLCLKRILNFGIALGILLYSAGGWAAQDVYVITLKDHQFSPAELTIPARAKVKIIVENQDTTPEEFESYDLNREKVVTGKGKITLYIGPLNPGKYKYFGDFHPNTAQGIIIVK